MCVRVQKQVIIVIEERHEFLSSIFIITQSCSYKQYTFIVDDNIKKKNRTIFLNKGKIEKTPKNWWKCPSRKSVIFRVITLNVLNIS